MPKLLTDLDYALAAERLNCEEAAIRAVAEVESGPYGAFLPTGEPVILFERHIFHRLTGGKWTNFFRTTEDGRRVFPYRDISNPEAGKYGDVSIQHQRLARAVELDRDAALQSASWGRFQVLGRNWQSLGYPSLQAFINAMYRDEAGHLDAFIRYVEANNLTDELRRKDWNGFARGYNGIAYRKYAYHLKMAAAYAKYAKGR